MVRKERRTHRHEEVTMRSHNPPPYFLLQTPITINKRQRLSTVLFLFLFLLFLRASEHISTCSRSHESYRISMVQSTFISCVSLLKIKHLNTFAYVSVTPVQMSTHIVFFLLFFLLSHYSMRSI